MKKRLENKINKFLKEKRKSNGGYAPVEKGDIQQLNDIIDAILVEKYELDPDGDLPINWDIINRHKYEPNGAVRLVPYSHKDREGNLKAITNNLSYFSERLDKIMKYGKIQFAKGEDDDE